MRNPLKGLSGREVWTCFCVGLVLAGAFQSLPRGDYWLAFWTAACAVLMFQNDQLRVGKTELRIEIVRLRRQLRQVDPNRSERE